MWPTGEYGTFPGGSVGPLPPLLPPETADETADLVEVLTHEAVRIGLDAAQDEATRAVVQRIGYVGRVVAPYLEFLTFPFQDGHGGLPFQDITGETIVPPRRQPEGTIRELWGPLPIGGPAELPQMGVTVAPMWQRDP